MAARAACMASSKTRATVDSSRCPPEGLARDAIVAALLFPMMSAQALVPRATLVVAAALGGVLGVSLQLQQVALGPGAVYGLSLALAGLLLVWLLYWRHAKPLPGVWLLAMALAAGTAAGWGQTGLRAVAYAAQALDPALEGPDIHVTGRVASLPQTGAQGVRFVLAVETAQSADRGVPVVLPRRLLLSWYLQPGSAADGRLAPDLQAGDRWQLTVRLRRPHGAANPHGFDRERWLWEQGVGATGSVRTSARAGVPRRLDASGLHPVQAARQWVRDRILQRVDDARQAGVLAALVVGDQSAIDRADWALFRATGISHLVSISGLHITVFAWLATLAVGAVWRQLAFVRPQVLLAVSAPVAAGWGGLGLAGAYAVFSGGGVPAQRTVLMLALMVGLRLAGRRWPWPLVWLAAMVAVLLLDPWALLQPGFWLSFVAVGVLFAADPLRPTEVAGPAPYQALVQRVLRLLREQAIVTVALAPLSLLLFGQFSLAGLLANLLAIPWVTFVITPLALLGVLVPGLWELAAWAVGGLITWLQWLGEGPWAVWQRPVAPWPLALLAVPGGVLLVLRLPPVVRAAGLMLAWPLLVWTPQRPPVGQFELLAMDVGQGSAVLVRTASHSLLYDTGPRYSPDSDAGDLLVNPLLRALGESPDKVVVSHRDSDHAGGAASVQAAFPQARWLGSMPGPLMERCLAGQRWAWDGVEFDILHPQAQHYGPDGQGRLTSNAMSCVLRIRAGGQAALLAGDLDAEQETRLALSQPDLRADVLLAPHHGSLTSSSPVLLNTLRPRSVLVQAGYRNRFGHPAPDVLARYEARGIQWRATPECGAITWRSQVPQALGCHRHDRQRYWHHPAGAPDAADRLEPARLAFDAEPNF